MDQIILIEKDKATIGFAYRILDENTLTFSTGYCKEVFDRLGEKESNKQFANFLIDVFNHNSLQEFRTNRFTCAFKFKDENEYKNYLQLTFRAISDVEEGKVENYPDHRFKDDTKEKLGEYLYKCYGINKESEHGN